MTRLHVTSTRPFRNLHSPVGRYQYRWDDEGWKGHVHASGSSLDALAHVTKSLDIKGFPSLMCGYGPFKNLSSGHRSLEKGKSIEHNDSPPLDKYEFDRLTCRDGRSDG